MESDSYTACGKSYGYGQTNLDRQGSDDTFSKQEKPSLTYTQRPSSSVTRSHSGTAKHINFKEMYTVLHALRSWTSKYRACRIKLHCNNEEVVAALAKRGIKGQAISPLRQLAMHIALHDIELHCLWITTKETSLADALTQWDTEKMGNLCPDFEYISEATDWTLGTQIATSTPRLHDISCRDSAPRPDRHIPPQETTSSKSALYEDSRPSPHRSSCSDCEPQHFANAACSRRPSKVTSQAKCHSTSTMASARRYLTTIS